MTRLLTTNVVAGAALTAVIAMSAVHAHGDTSNPVAHITCHGHKPSGYSTGQLHNAATIVAVGRNMGVPDRGQVVAVATAMQESSLHNLAGGDRDSIGLFQQRPSQGWGSPAQLHNPEYTARKFYRALRKVHGWQHMPVTQAAQAVQNSAYPGAYAKHQADATKLVGCTKH